MELKGTLIVERRPLRRWVSAIAVIVPVVAFVGATAWFVRAFVAPPMIAIPSPMMLASAPPAPAPKATQKATPTAPPKAAAPEQPQPASAAAPAAPPTAEAPAPAEKPADNPTVTAAAAPAMGPATGLPMFASLAVAPPALTSGSTHSAFADPTADRQTTMMPADTAPQSAEPEAADPITGAVPIPRSRPEVAVALVTANVPLPRSRPSEAAPEPAPEIVQFNRHFAE